MTKKISELPGADALADADLFEVAQSGVSKKVTAALIRAGMLPSSDYITIPGALEAPGGIVVNPGGVGKTFYSSHALTSVGEGAFSLAAQDYNGLTHTFKVGAAGDITALVLNADGSITLPGLSAALAAQGYGKRQIIGPITVTPADVPDNAHGRLILYTPPAGALIYDILMSWNPVWNHYAQADFYDGNPDVGHVLGSEGNIDWSQTGSPVDAFGGRGLVSLCALTGGAPTDNFPLVSTGQPLVLRMTYGEPSPGDPTTGSTKIYLDVAIPVANTPVITYYLITTVDQGAKTFTVDGDASTLTGSIHVVGSTGNDATYTVVTATFDTDHTDIVVVEAIASATADGWVKQ